MTTLTPNSLSVHWRIALGAAQNALHAQAGCPGLKVPSTELRERGAALERERDAVQHLLERDAHVVHLPLVRRLAFPIVQRQQLGLPTAIEACVFELDGVLTPSAELHYAAWATAFDGFLVRRFAQASVHLSHLARLSRRADYEQQLHGQPRLDGLRALLASRGLTLPEGSPSDPPESETIHGLANAKNRVLQALLQHEGIDAYAGSARYLEALEGSGLGCAVVSASANAQAILARAELSDLVDVVVDGAAMRELGLRPKPAADLLIAACEGLDLPPARVAAFETTAAGVAAAHTAGIGFVVFVARHEAEPGEVRAGRVVPDLAQLLRTAA